MQVRGYLEVGFPIDLLFLISNKESITMAIETSRITLHMVSSLDGFIAKRDGDISWMQSADNYEKGITLSEEYISNFLNSIDCYVMGSYTYEHALELGWPYGDKPVWVISSRKLQSDRSQVEFFSGDLRELAGILKKSYDNIWMVGGPALTKEFLNLNLVNNIVITIAPIILGDGLLFFNYVGKEIKLHLKDVMAFNDGMVELCYEIRD